MFRLPAASLSLAAILAAVLSFAPGAQGQALPDLESTHFFPAATTDARVPTPESVLGYPLGRQFTRHDEQLNYLRTLDAASDRVVMRPYGRTVEGRPLAVLFISSPRNLADLDGILARNRKLADPALAAADRDAILDSNPMIAWLSYNVHGNEPSSAEAVMRVAYELAALGGGDIDAILANLVVVLDPLVNPDGHDRYVNWYRTVIGSSPNAATAAAEHHEPWPGGRANHYLFDLNRDWVWCVQPESKARLALYRTVLPQLHLDFHEQEYRNPYFLGLGDDPYNTNIPASTREWVGRYGADAGATFDRNGLVYSTKERFDYLYPGYGKVLPCYHGAIGLLYEQGGHSMAGLAIEVDENYTLTLSERVRNHYLSSMTALAYSAAHRREQLDRFAAYFRESIDFGRASPETYFIAADNDPALLARVARLCATHGIVIEELASGRSTESLFDYYTGRPWRQSEPPATDAQNAPGTPQREFTQATLPAGTWVIRTDQPMGRLARALFERTTTVTDRQTYDISSWSVPICFGLRAWYCRDGAALALRPLEFNASEGRIVGEGDLALVIDAAQFDFPAAIGLAARMELTARFTGEDSTLDGRRFSRGSLIVYRARNGHADLESFASQCAGLGLVVTRIASGMSTEGPVLGARDNPALDLPRVALLRGGNSLSFGEVWHLLDVECPIPHTVIASEQLSAETLDDFNVLILPDGASLSGATADRVKAWAQAGGTIIALESAATWCSSSLLDLEEPKDPKDIPSRPEPNTLTHSERRDRAIEDQIPGTLIQVDLDTTHPLTAGLGSSLGVLKDRDARQRIGSASAVVGRYAPEPAIGEAISQRNVARIAGAPAIAVHRFGSGRVIAFGDPLTTRGFTLAPRRLLLNAIVYGPSLSR